MNIKIVIIKINKYLKHVHIKNYYLTIIIVPINVLHAILVMVL